MITISEKYMVDNKEFQVYMDEKDYIIIKHIEAKPLKKYTCTFADGSASCIKMVENKNKIVYRYLIDCFEGKKFTIINKADNYFMLQNIISTPYQSHDNVFSFLEKPLDQNDLLEIEHAKKINELKELQINCDFIYASYDQLNVKHKKLNDEFFILKSQNNELNEEHDKLKTLHRDAIEAEDSLSKEYKKLFKKYEQTNELYNKLDYEYAKLRQEHDKLNNEYFKLLNLPIKEEMKILSEKSSPQDFQEYMIAFLAKKQAVVLNQ